jgi:hypothetical protein
VVSCLAEVSLPAVAPTITGFFGAGVAVVAKEAEALPRERIRVAAAIAVMGLREITDAPWVDGTSN